MNDEIKDEAWWKRQTAAHGEWWRKRAVAQQDESLRQNNQIYGGLIGIGAILVQPFVTTPADSLDLSAIICVLAFSVAIPILSALIMLNRQESYRRRVSSSLIVMMAQQGGLALGLVGVVAGFWHIMPIAGIAFLVSAIVGLTVHSVGWVRVEKEDAQATPGGEPPPEL